MVRSEEVICKIHLISFKGLLRQLILPLANKNVHLEYERASSDAMALNSVKKGQTLSGFTSISRKYMHDCKYICDSKQYDKNFAVLSEHGSSGPGRCSLTSLYFIPQETEGNRELRSTRCFDGSCQDRRGCDGYRVYLCG